MDLVFRGRVAWKFGDFFQGDLVMGRRGMYDRNKDPENLKRYVLIDYEPDFPVRFQVGELMVAGRAFGVARDHGSVRALKALGVSAVVAESFGRVWYRRAIMNALPIVECCGISQAAERGDTLEVSLQSGIVRNLTTGQTLVGIPAIEPQLAILAAGDITEYLRAKARKQNIGG